MTLAKDRGHIPTIGNLIDFRDANLKFKELDSSKYINFIQENSSVQGDRLVALLTTSSQEASNDHEYQLLAKGLPMDVKVFTNLANCMSWTKNAHPNQAMLRFIQEQKNKL
jgi:hypothetical protein